MFIEIKKLRSRFYEIRMHYPKERSIRVAHTKNLDKFAEKTFKGDDMGLASFNRARELAKKQKDQETDPQLIDESVADESVANKSVADESVANESVADELIETPDKKPNEEPDKESDKESFKDRVKKRLKKN